MLIYEIVVVFVIGSLLGWIIEFFYRRIVSQKKWGNPGFLKGPYLPLYGFGFSILYIVSNIKLPFNFYLSLIIKTISFSLFVILLELFSGLILQKKFHLKLWDYSSRKFNYKGIICPLYSLYWILGGLIYLLVIHSFFQKMISAINTFQLGYFFIGIIFGSIIIETLKITSKKIK